MKGNNFPDSYKQVITIFLLVTFFTWIGISGYFYEDNFYIYYVTSFLQDHDFNIINQVPFQHARIVTEKFSHPTHHSILQTPALLILSGFDWILGKIGNNAIAPFKLAGILLNMISLSVGFIFLRKTAELLNTTFRFSHFLFFLLSTALFYFSFFTLTVIEIFNFALSSFALYGTVLLYKKRDHEIDGFSLGTAAAMVLTSKMTYLPLFFAATYFAVTSTRKLFLRYLTGALLVFTIVILKDIASFGELSLIGRAMGEFTITYSLLDIYYTVKDGMFGVGGLFYTNPAYLLGFIGCLMLFHSAFSRNKNSLILFGSLSLWLLMGLFQTTFIVGPAMEDHYVGRIMLIALPLMLLGISTLSGLIRNTFAKILFYVLFPLWQLFTLAQFLFISKDGHYKYALQKYVSDLSSVFQFFEQILKTNFHNFIADGLKVFIFVFLSTALLYFLYGRRDKLTFQFNLYLRYSSLVLLIFTVMNCFTSKNHGEEYLMSQGMRQNVVIANDHSLYSFIYIVDILRTQYLNTNDPILKEMIRKKHSLYLERIKPHLEDAPYDFRQAIRDEDTEYGIFR